MEKPSPSSEGNAFQQEHISLLQHVFPEMLSPESRQSTLSLSNLDSYLEMRLMSSRESTGTSSVGSTGAVGSSGDSVGGIRIGPHEVKLSLSTNVGGEIIVENGGLGVTGNAEFSTVRATTGVATGRWVYEMYLVTKGVMQLGWCTLECRFSRDKGVGDTIDSYAFDGSRVRKWNVASKKYGETWLPCDVITCAIDCDQGDVSFYRNGRFLGLAFTQIRLGPGVAYFPSASLMKGESVIFNFGGTPLMHPIEGYRPIQDPPLRLIKEAELLCSYWQRLLPISVDSEKNDRVSMTLGLQSPTTDLVNPEIRWLKTTCLQIAAHLMKYCQPMLLHSYTIQCHVIRLLLKFCDRSCPSEQAHVNFFLQMVWSFMDTASATKVLTHLARALIHLYRFSTTIVNSKQQANYLHLLRGILLHGPSKDYLLRHVLFDSLSLPSLFHVKSPDDTLLSTLVPVVSFNDLPLAENEDAAVELQSTLEASTDGRREEFHHAVSAIEKEVDVLTQLHKEILKIMLRDDDFSPLDRKCSREIFVQKMREMVHDQSWPVGATCLNFLQRLLSVIRELWEELSVREKSVCPVDEVYLPVEIFILDENAYFDTQRLGGLLSHLKKAFRSEVHSMRKTHQERRERKGSAVSGFSFFKKLTEDVKDGRTRRFLKECVFDEANRVSSESSKSCSPSPSVSGPAGTGVGGVNSLPVSPLDKLVVSPSPPFSPASPPKSALPSLLSGVGSSGESCGISPSDAGGSSPGGAATSTNVVVSVSNLLSLLDLTLWIYHKAACAHHEKIASNTREAVTKYRNALLETEEKLRRCPENKEDIRDALLVSKQVFEDKLTEFGRMVAWLMASVYNVTCRDNFFWLWRVLLNTFNEANRENVLFSFLPHFYLEACLNLHLTLRYHLHPVLPIPALRGFQTTLVEFAAFLCRSLLDLRMVNTESRDCVLQYIISFVQQPQCLHALESVPQNEVQRLLRVLTTPYENRSWSNTNWILGRFWKGCGFAFRSQSPRSTRGGSADALSTKPCPSIVFQNHLKRFLAKEQDVTTKFLNSVLTQLNWSFSEMISNMQDLRQGHVQNPFLLRYLPDSNNARLCTVFFDIAVALLRVLEMVIHLLPELFLDPAKPQSENFCSRLMSLVGQILHRTTSKNGLFEVILQQQHPGLEKMDRLQLYSAVAGVLVELVLQPCPQWQQQALRMCLNEPGFLLTSLEYMLDGPAETTSSSSSSTAEFRLRSPPWNAASTSAGAGRGFFSSLPSDFICLRQSDEVSEDELSKLEKVIELLKNNEAMQKSDAEKCKEEDLCVICYAQANSAVFRPCGHMSCKSCITHQMLAKGECFFCKVAITRVDDMHGKEIRFK